MKSAVTYCPTRRDLEERGWFLTSRLSELTTKLMRMIGRDHHAFLSLKSECLETRLEIQSAHRNLQEHRLEHGC